VNSTFTLNGGQTIAGNGSVVGNFIAPSNSTISPGPSGHQLGKLTFSNNVTMNGVMNVFDLTVAGNDVIQMTAT